jgi:FHA domain
MLNPEPEHPATSFSARGNVCADARCATLLEVDAEICDECAGTRFTPLQAITARLCGWAGERPVVFRVYEDKPSIIGRSTPEHVPEVDLRRFPGSDVIHRRHARLQFENGNWQLSHLGTNLLSVIRNEPITLEPGETVVVRSGDALEIGNVVLQFAARSSPGGI